jgi:lipopolysaccharide transport system permease protein
MSRPFPPSTAPVTHVVAPNRRWLRFDPGELWDRRDLLFLLFRRDFVSRYRQTLLGPAWHVLQPLALALVFTVVFGRVAAIPTEGAPGILFYLAGLLGWNACSHSLQATSSTFGSNADLFGKVYFPRLVVPLAAVLTSVVALGLQLGVFLLMLAGYKLLGPGGEYGIQWSALWLPLLALEAAALGLGVGLWISSVTARYRDVKHAMPFLMLLWMFLTPVIYPLSRVPPEYQAIALANPVAPVVEAFRHALLGAGRVAPVALGGSIASTLLLLVSGVLIFQRTERTVVDTL